MPKLRRVSSAAGRRPTSSIKDSLANVRANIARRPRRRPGAQRRRVGLTPRGSRTATTALIVESCRCLSAAAGAVRRSPGPAGLRGRLGAEAASGGPVRRSVQGKLRSTKSHAGDLAARRPPPRAPCSSCAGPLGSQPCSSCRIHCTRTGLPTARDMTAASSAASSVPRRP